MKRWIVFWLSAVLLLNLAACDIDEIKVPKPAVPQQTQTQPGQTVPTEPEKTAYEVALEENWVIPERGMLSEILWHSELGYELKLYHEPGQMYDGYVMLYEEHDSGDYVSTYTGNWLYADGILTLAMEPYYDTDPIIQGDFPVLADPYGELTIRIFPALDGTGLPMFAGQEYDELSVIHYDSEDPYTYALSQGWREPELWELADSGWLSFNGYFLELMEDSVPGDTGGNARICDVDAMGAYTRSYYGSWSYQDGYLHLCLFPEFDTGYFIDDSFPVLMLDGMLWIGRTEYGFGLPHFYEDQLIDVLEQPKG